MPQKDKIWAEEHGEDSRQEQILQDELETEEETEETE